MRETRHSPLDILASVVTPEPTTENDTAAEELLHLSRCDPHAAFKWCSHTLPALDEVRDTAQTPASPLINATSMRVEDDDDDIANEKGASPDRNPTLSDSLHQLPKKRSLQELQDLTSMPSFEPAELHGGLTHVEKSPRIDPPENDHMQSLGTQQSDSTPITDFSVCTEMISMPLAEELEIKQLSSGRRDTHNTLFSDTDHHSSVISKAHNYGLLATGKDEPAALDHLIPVDDTCVVLGYTRAGTRALQLWREVRGSRRHASEQEVELLVERLQSLLGISGRPVFLVQVRSVADATYYWDFQLKNGTLKLSYWKEASIEDLQRDINTKRHASKKSSPESSCTDLSVFLSCARGYLSRAQMEKAGDDAFLGDVEFLEHVLALLAQLSKCKCSVKLHALKEKFTIEMITNMFRTTGVI